MNLFQIFYEISVKYGENVALNFEEKNMTYKELLDSTMRRKALLLEQGIEPGTIAAIFMSDEFEFILTLFALWAIDCIPIPLDKNMKAMELERAADISQYWVTNEKKQKEISVIKSDKGRTLAQKDTGIIFFTSGTTGIPKGVCFSSLALYKNVIDVAEKIGIQNRDQCYTPISVMYTAVITTIVLPALLTGASLVIRKTQLPQNVIRVVREQKIDIFYAVPYMFQLMCEVLEEGSQIFYCSKAVLSSSAYMEEELFSRFFRLTGNAIRTIYCSSEAGAITYNDFEETELIRSTVGRAFEHVNIKIIREGTPVGLGEIGEIYVSGSHIASGYINEKEIEGQVFLNGWIKTGDLGAQTKECGIILHGRADDTINAAGHLVSPDEVEMILKEYHQIEDALVYGIKKKLVGEVVAAKIVLKKGVDLSDFNDIKRYCRSRLSSFKVPGQITVVEKIPKGKYGKKIRKKEGT